MKNFILLLIAICLSITAGAQIHKGTSSLGGSVSGSYNKSDNNSQPDNNSSYRNNSWSFSFSHGKYITDKIAIGAGAGFSMFDYNSTNVYSYGGPATTSTNRQKSMMYHVTPFVRNTRSISDKLYCYGTLYANAGMGAIKNTMRTSANLSESSEGMQTTFGGGITGGLYYFLNNHFALSLSYGDLSYGYTTTKMENDSGIEHPKSTENGVSVNLGLSSLGFGLQYFFDCCARKK